MRKKVKDKIEKLATEHILNDGPLPDGEWAEQCEKLIMSLSLAGTYLIGDKKGQNLKKVNDFIIEAIKKYEEWLDETE